MTYEAPWSLIMINIFDREPGNITLRLGKNRWLSLRFYKEPMWFWYVKSIWGTYRRNLGRDFDRWTLDMGYVSIVWEDM